MMEYLDVVDENGQPTGQIVERSVAHKEGIPHRTSHVWLLRHHDGALQVLLQKRCMTKDSFPGCYDISSAGHIPAGMDFAESAIRELSEELGVQAIASDLVYCGDRTTVKDNIFYGHAFHDRQFSRIYLLWLDQPLESFTVQKEEIDSIIWMDFQDCLQAVRNNSFPHCMYVEELEMVRAKADQMTPKIQ